MTAFDTVRAEIEGTGMRLRRSWPRSDGHLLLDLDAGSGVRVAGQWFADRSVAADVAAATPGARPAGRVVLQPEGADRVLTELPGLLRRPGSRLIAHRSERRAVVALDDGARFAKLVDGRRRAERIRRGLRRVAGLPIRTPVLAGDDAGPVVTTDALPGRPLTGLFATANPGPALVAVGEALARLHGCAAPSGSGLHGPADELAVTEGWEERARAFGLPLPSVAEMPPPPPVLRPVAIHRDVHDGQFLVSGDPGPDGVGLLDFDLLAAGDPALDLANLIEHLRLRGRQGVLVDPDAAIAALLDGYRPDAGVRERLPGYRALTARRLAAVYAFRAPDLAT